MSAVLLPICSGAAATPKVCITSVQCVEDTAHCQRWQDADNRYPGKCAHLNAGIVPDSIHIVKFLLDQALPASTSEGDSACCSRLACC